MKTSRIAWLGMLLLASAASQAQPAADTGTPRAQPAIATGQAVKMREVELGPSLYQLAYSPRQKAIFVASAGDRLRPDESPGKIYRVDPQTLAVQAVIPMDLRSYGMALDDAADRLYVGHHSDAAVSAIDTRTNKVVGRVEVSEKAPNKQGEMRPTLGVRYITLDPGRHRMYLNGQGWYKENTLYVIDTRTMKITHTLPGFGTVKAPGIAIDPEGQRLFMSSFTPELFTVDTEKMAIVSRVRLQAEQAITMVYEPSSKRILAVDQGAARMRYFQEKDIVNFKSVNPGNQIIAIDSTTGKEIRQVPAADGPLDLLLDSKTKRLFVTHREGGKVSIYESDDLALLQTIDVPPMPNSLAYDEADNALFVTVKNDPGMGTMPDGRAARKHPAGQPALPEKLVRIDLPR